MQFLSFLFSCAFCTIYDIPIYGVSKFAQRRDDYQYKMSNQRLSTVEFFMSHA